MKINRESVPLPNKEIDFKLPEIQKFKLNFGSEVYFVKKENLPITQFVLISNAGSRFDPNEKKGVSTLLSALIDEGAGGLTSLEINDKLETLGSMLSVSNSQDSFIFSLLTLNENLQDSLDVFSKIVTSPNLDEKDFLREKRKQLTRIIQSKDNPSYIAGTVFEKLIYGRNNPYGLSELGNLHTVESIELEDMQAFYSSLITPSNSTFIVTGNIEKDELAANLEKYFSNWNDVQPLIFTPAEVKPHPTKIYFVDKKDAPQSEIILGHISKGRHTPDFYARQIMNSILGGQFTSRINLNLREDKGFTYGAHSSFQFNAFDGVFSAGCAVDTENTAPAIREIINELNGIIEEVKQEELEFAKSSFIRKFPAMFETYGHIARNLANIVIYSLPIDYYDNYISRIKNVTLQEVSDAAKNNILTENLTVVVVGDKNKIPEQLKELNLGNITELNDEGEFLGIT